MESKEAFQEYLQRTIRETKNNISNKLKTERLQLLNSEMRALLSQYQIIPIEYLQEYNEILEQKEHNRLVGEIIKNVDHLG